MKYGLKIAIALTIAISAMHGSIGDNMLLLAQLGTALEQLEKQIPSVTVTPAPAAPVVTPTPGKSPAPASSPSASSSSGSGPAPSSPASLSKARLIMLKTKMKIPKEIEDKLISYMSNPTEANPLPKEVSQYVIVPDEVNRQLEYKCAVQDKNLVTWQLSRIFTAGQTISAALSSDGRRVIAKLENKTEDEKNGPVKVWNADDGQLMHEFTGDAVVLSPNNKFVLTISKARNEQNYFETVGDIVRVWNTDDGKQLQLPGHKQLQFPENINYSSSDPIVWGADSTHVAIQSGSTVRIWDIYGNPPHELKDMDGDVVALSPHGKSAVVALKGWVRERKYSVQIWNIENKKLLNEIPGKIAAISSDSRHIIIGQPGGVLTLWNVDTGKGLNNIPAERGGIGLSPDGKRVVTWSLDVIQVWNIDTGQLVHELHDYLVSTPPLGNKVRVQAAVNKDNGTILTWNNNDELLREFHEPYPDPSSIINSVASSEDDKRIAILFNKKIQMWSGDGELLHEFDKPPLPSEGRVGPITVSQDGTRMMIPWGKNICIWQQQVFELTDDELSRLFVASENDNAKNYLNELLKKRGQTPIVWKKQAKRAIPSGSTPGSKLLSQ